MDIMSMKDLATMLANRPEYERPVKIDPHILDEFTNERARAASNERMMAEVMANKTYLDMRMSLICDKVREAHGLPEDAKFQIDLLLGTYRLEKPTTPKPPEWVDELLTKEASDKLM